MCFVYIPVVVVICLSFIFIDLIVHKMPTHILIDYMANCISRES